jgi:hypothetical protein
MTLTMQFYETAIEMAAPRKIFITTDEPNHPFINQFKKYKPIILTWLKREKEKAVLDLFSAMHFKKIAMSCSTFSWWSALLSDASKIYFPIDEDGMWSKCHINPDSLRQNIRTSIDLRVDDPRIIYFYNCPTIKTNRISPGLLSLSAAAPNLMPFHRNSIAFWYR